VSVIVVSNRVARIKPDDPIAGELAAALLPMVRGSGAIWVGSSGQPGDVTQTPKPEPPCQCWLSSADT
jgi:trehalose 6-phosphate synthase